ncbi:MAG: protein translocase subunit SecD, partial [Gammaproteobacteria bacterium]|nr:protein translocase subunit SecD [Gammaproteobacteria bacterium]
MLNRYPAWKNLLVLLTVALGILYSVPNLYPDDEALQVTHESRELVQPDLDNITTALEAAQLQTLASELNDSGILLRFDTVEEQLRGKTAIEEALTDDFIVALNLAPTTPSWMQAIGAGKMNLGLDLQGGVHFLME